MPAARAHPLIRPQALSARPVFAAIPIANRRYTKHPDEIKRPGVAYLLFSMAFTYQRATRQEPCGSDNACGRWRVFSIKVYCTDKSETPWYGVVHHWWLIFLSKTKIS